MRKKKIREVIGFWLLHLRYPPVVSKWSQVLAYKLIMSVGNQSANLWECNTGNECGHCDACSHRRAGSVTKN